MILVTWPQAGEMNTFLPILDCAAVFKVLCVFAHWCGGYTHLERGMQHVSVCLCVPTGCASWYLPQWVDKAWPALFLPGWDNGQWAGLWGSSGGGVGRRVQEVRPGSCSFQHNRWVYSLMQHLKEMERNGPVKCFLIPQPHGWSVPFLGGLRSPREVQSSTSCNKAACGSVHRGRALWFWESPRPPTECPRQLGHWFWNLSCGAPTFPFSTQSAILASDLDNMPACNLFRLTNWEL